MRFSHAFKYPWFPFVAEEVDQKEQEAPALSPERKKGGRPRKPSHEKAKSKRKKLLDGEQEVGTDLNGDEDSKSNKKRDQKSQIKWTLTKQPTVSSNFEEEKANY